MMIVAVVLLAACKTTERVVTVPEVHEYHHHHTDSVKQVDSVRVEKETVVMQLDSAAMAAYGIRLEAAERAWLVKTKELEKALSRVNQTVADTVHVRDSIPVPYPVPVTKEVEKPSLGSSAPACTEATPSSPFSASAQYTASGE